MFNSPGAEIQKVADMLQERAVALQELQDGGHKSLLEFARDQIAQTFERSFSDSVDPDGKKWLPLKYRRVPPPILILTGALHQETRGVIDSPAISHDQLKITCPVDYGHMMQMGIPSHNVPARPFLGLNDENIQAIYDEGVRQVNEAFLGGQP